MFKSRIYLDYASLTPIDPRVIREMKVYSSCEYANPSSLYKEGVAAKNALARGRQKVADYINAHANEIIFTNGGTEANNLALVGVVRVWQETNAKAQISNDKKPHIIISSIEHSSIIETARMLEQQGCEVTRLSLDAHGVISLDELKKSIQENTVLISIMIVNNEIGSVQPIKEVAKIIRHAKKPFDKLRASKEESCYPLFHTDAAQALYEEINMNNLGVDLLTLDGGKVYGPRGVGALYIKRGTPIENVVYGGDQEFGLRAGTENLQGIMGFAKAVEIMTSSRQANKQRSKIAGLKTYFITELQKVIPDIKVNGDINNTAPHIVNVSIPGIDNEFFLFQLDAKGIACSTKSSCLRDEDESYVLKSIGASSKESIRFSFGRWTTKRELRKVVKIVSKLCLHY